MTLKEILDSIKLRYPHSYTDGQIVTMLNDIQRQIFRTIYRVETTSTQDIFAGNPYYPITFSPDSIIKIVVNGHEYPHQNIKYAPQERFYYNAEQGFIGLYPTPQETVVEGLTVFHYKEPATLSADDIEEVPDFDHAWHELLVYHACQKLAEIARDHNMAKVFMMSVNRLENEYKRSKTARPHKTQDIYDIGRGMH